jgi:alpha-1,6-mannosyltransferase
VKICDLTQFYSPVSGGVRRYIAQKAAHIRSHCPGCSHVLVVPGETTSCEGDETARVYTIASPLVSRTSRYRMLLKLHLVEEVLERERPDIIESGDPYQLAWKAVASGRGLGIPVVGFYHSHFPEALLRSVERYSGRALLAIAAEASRRYVKVLYNHFAATFVPGPALAALIESWGVERVRSIDLGVDTAVFAPSDSGREATRAALDIPPNATVLLYVGRLAPEKNVGTLFAAFRLLAREPHPFHLVVVGDGTWRRALAKLASETGAVTWKPYCDDPAQLAGIYRAADLFVHPGIQETFGLVTLESQACGTPVVGIRGSYMDRIIFSDQFHWAAENSPASLATAVLASYRDNPRAAGIRAGTEVRSRFSWETAFGRLFAIYDEVVSKRQTRGQTQNLKIDI